MRISTITFIILISVVASCTNSVCGDTITMKTSFRMRAGETSVKLSDIAELEGTDAASFANVTVATMKETGAVVEISVAELRKKLTDAGINWARNNLSGRAVAIRPNRDGGDANAPLAMSPASLKSIRDLKKDESAPQQMNAADLVAQPTLRGIIAGLIAGNLQIKPGDLRLTFDANDQSLLEMSVQSTRFEVQPLGSFAGDRIDLAVRIWAGNKVQQGRTISVQPAIRVQAATVRRDLRRDETFNENDLEQSERWLSPSQSALTASKTVATGRIAAKSLKAGEVVRENDIRRDMLIKRGEQAMVRCLVGGVAISMQAEARADGSDGDMIEFRKQGERQSFRARVTGRGEAIVDLSKN